MKITDGLYKLYHVSFQVNCPKLAIINGKSASDWTNLEGPLLWGESDQRQGLHSY